MEMSKIIMFNLTRGDKLFFHFQLAITLCCKISQLERLCMHKYVKNENRHDSLGPFCGERERERERRKHNFKSIHYVVFMLDRYISYKG